MNLTITFDAATLNVGGQTITGPASVSVPVSPEQLVALLSGGGGRMEIAPEPPPAIDAPHPELAVEPLPATAAPEPAVAEEPVVASHPVIDHITVRKGRWTGKLAKMTDEDLRQAFTEAGSAKAAAEMLGASMPSVYAHKKRLGFEFGGRKPHVSQEKSSPVKPVVTPDVYDGPADEGATARMRQRALDLGLWHLNDDGSIVKYPKGEPPTDSDPDLLVVPSTLPPGSPFNQFPVRRKAIPAGTPEENRRLIDEAIAAGRIKKLKPGAAINAHSAQKM